MKKGFPITMDRAVFLSDAHLNKDDDETRAFVRLAEKAAGENVALFLLGDIFDLWFGAPAFTFDFQKPVIGRLKELRRGGLHLYYVEGNRDFYLKKYYEGNVFDAVADGEMFAAVGDARVYLSHGDTVNRADIVYRFWKAVSKNRLVFGAVSALPASLFLPMANWFERKLKRTNVRYRTSFPERECREFAQGRHAAGIDLVILGHFHQERLFRFPSGGKEHGLAILPVWRENRRYLYMTSGRGYGFRSFHPDEPLIP